MNETPTAQLAAKMLDMVCGQYACGDMNEPEFTEEAMRLLDRMSPVVPAFPARRTAVEITDGMRIVRRRFRRTGHVFAPDASTPTALIRRAGDCWLVTDGRTGEGYVGITPWTAMVAMVNARLAYAKDAEVEAQLVQARVDVVLEVRGARVSLANAEADADMRYERFTPEWAACVLATYRWLTAV